METSRLDLEELGSQRARVERLAVALVGDVHMAEDLAQESWLRLIQSGGPQHEGARVPWLRTAVQRIGWNEWRGAARRRHREQEVAQREELPSSSEIAERSELCKKIGDAIDELSPIYAEALRDHYFGGLSNEEIARRDGVSSNTIKSRVSRGRALLREKLERLGLGGDVHWSVAIIPLLPRGFVPPAPAAVGAGAATTSASGGATGAGLQGVTGGARGAASLWSTSRVLWLLVLLTVAGAVLTITLTRTEEALQDSGRTVQVGDARSAAPAKAPSDALAAGSGATDAAPRTAVAPPTPPPSASAAAPRALITGRVVDWEGHPLEGATARIAALGDWAAGVDATRYDDPAYGRKRTHFGFEARTDANGSFVLDVPMPDADETRLSIVPDRYHRRVGRIAGAGRTEWLAPLQDGPLDAGTFKLAPTGAVEGRVVDENGAPLAGVLINGGLDPRRRTAVPTRTGPDGRFELLHVTPGRTELIASLPGKRDALRTDVIVHAGATREIEALVLEPTLRLEGVLVDHAGDPIAGQLVRCSSLDGRRVIRAKSGQDGRFSLDLPSVDEHRLRIDRRGSAPAEQLVRGHDPSAEDLPPALRIQLFEAPPATFRVVDDETGRVIERFGFAIVPPGIDAPRPRAVARPRGEASGTARRGVDRVAVIAPGFVLSTVLVAEDLEPAATQTVRLSRGARVTGVLMAGDLPIGGASVNVQLGQVRALTSVAVDSLGREIETFRPSTLPPATAVTRADGTFEVTGLDAGLHRVTFRGRADVRVDRWPVEVAALGSVELGEIDVERAVPSSVRGRIHLPPGVSTAGLVAHLEGFPGCGPVDASGQFRFDGVPPGTYVIGWNELPGTLAESAGLGVVVPPDARCDVELDAREHTVGTVEATVFDAAGPRSGLRVAVVDAASGRTEIIGLTSSSGLAAAFARTSALATVRVTDPSTGAVHDHPGALVLLAGEKVAVKVELPAGF